MKVLYVTDDNGIDQFLASVLSLNHTNPEIEALVYFTEEGISSDIPLARFTIVPKTLELIALYGSFPEKNMDDPDEIGSHTPKTTYMKIPVIASLNLDDLLYVDIDTIFAQPLKELLSLVGPGLSVSHSKMSAEAGSDFNAGVMFFKKDFWTPSLLDKYIKIAMDSKGKWSDQETLTKMKLDFTFLPAGYNTRSLSSKTIILHFAGKKPFHKKEEEYVSADKLFFKWFDMANSILRHI